MTEPKQHSDMTFMFLMLNHHKGCAWDFKAIADKLGMVSGKSAENRYYKLKKAHYDAVGGTELLGSTTAGEATPKKPKATPKDPTKSSSKKRQQNDDGNDQDDEETPVKGKGGSKKRKAESDEEEEKPVKAEPKAESEEDGELV